MEEPNLALSAALLYDPVELEQYEDANENKAQHLTAAPTEGTEQLDEAEKQELFTLEDKILQAIALPKRWWYNGGKALGYIRDKRLYRETYPDFHQYCLYRFNKTRRHIDRWIAAAAALDNLTESGCTVLPTAESVLRPIASLPPEQQVEVWNQAVEAAGGYPIAAGVESVRDVFQGKTLPQSEINELEETAQLETPEIEVINTSLKLNLTWEQEFHERIEKLSITEMRNLHSWLGTLIKRLEDVEF